LLYAYKGTLQKKFNEKVSVTPYHNSTNKFTTALLSQTGKISGKIIDKKTGETLPGASVLIEGTVQGASSDFDGNYIITYC
jgi:hypothetical protein